MSFVYASHFEGIFLFLPNSSRKSLRLRFLIKKTMQLIRPIHNQAKTAIFDLYLERNNSLCT